MRTIKYFAIMAVMAAAMTLGKAGAASVPLPHTPDMEATKIYLLQKEVLEGKHLADSIPVIRERAKVGDFSGLATLAECYRYGIGVEKCLLNAIFCYTLGGIDIEKAARDIYEANPNDELGIFFFTMDLYDTQDREMAKDFLSSSTVPEDCTWIDMMRKILDYEGDDDGFAFSLLNDDSSGDECFVVLSHYISNSKNNADKGYVLKRLPDIADKIPFLYNTIGEYKIKKYRENQEGNPTLLEEAIKSFGKAHQSGFLTPRNARRIFEEDVNAVLDVKKLFSDEEVEKLKALGASTSAEPDNVEAVEMTPPEEAVELIEE